MQQAAKGDNVTTKFDDGVKPLSEDFNPFGIGFEMDLLSDAPAAHAMASSNPLQPDGDPAATYATTRGTPTMPARFTGPGFITCATCRKTKDCWIYWGWKKRR
ncbi:hypothetical protein ABK905_13960 [Acerihabitans sp. KWT182]|uniref:Uncharacterized protein n=1 Tax=Acerihabitans sp. KWT182 TaxID=3157919 RepID=A0AAU7Q4C5_9GAMM